MVTTTIHRYKSKGSPLTFTLDDSQILIYINWEKTTNREVYLTVEADKKVDILIPSTFNKLKERILDLENKLKMVCND